MKRATNEMTVVEHLEELRKRLIICLVAVSICTVASWFYSLPAIDLMTANLEAKLIYLHPADAFTMRLKISGMIGLLLASPIVFWQVWMFVVPGLYKHEKRYAAPVIITAVALFFVGAAFGVYTVPLTLNVLQKFGGGIMEANYTVDKFIGFSVSMILAFALVFESPLVLFFLVKIGIVPRDALVTGRKYALIVVLIVSAVVTPADVVSMVVMAVPLYLLFEISLLATKFVKPVTPSWRVPEDSEGGDQPSAGSTPT